MLLDEIFTDFYNFIQYVYYKKIEDYLVLLEYLKFNITASIHMLNEYLIYFTPVKLKKKIIIIINFFAYPERFLYISCTISRYLFSFRHKKKPFTFSINLNGYTYNPIYLPFFFIIIIYVSGT